MKYYPLSEIDPSRLSVIFMNGGGQRHIDKLHRLSVFFSQFNVNLISLELPGHGSSSFEKIIGSEEFILLFKKDMKELVNQLGKIAMVAFSLGGLFSLKIIEEGDIPVEFAIIFGAGVHIGHDQEEMIQNFTTYEFFEKRGWTFAMKKYHGLGWDTLLPSLSKLMSMKSNIWTDPVNLDSTDIFFLLGDNERAFTPELNFPKLKNDNIRKYKIEDCHHFEYFMKPWVRVEKYLIEIINQLDILTGAKA